MKEWICPKCDGRNYSRRIDCYKCKAEKPKEGISSKSHWRERSRERESEVMSKEGKSKNIVESVDNSNIEVSTILKAIESLAANPALCQVLLNLLKMSKG
jgi:hypothetical protein